MAQERALVTGASGGIGSAIALALAGAGYDLALTGRDAARLEAAREAAEARGVHTTAIPADLREPAAAARVVAAAAKVLGGPPTVLVNNAGTAPTARFERTDDATLDEVLDLHVRAPFRLVREVLPAMRDARRGVIVQLASSAGLRGFPFTSAYTAAKHALVGMTRALAIELEGSGVRTFALCPGFVDTDITRRAAAHIAARGKQTEAQAMAAMARLNRIGRMHTAEEIGAQVVKLCRELPPGCVYDLDADPPRVADA